MRSSTPSTNQNPDYSAMYGHTFITDGGLAVVCAYNALLANLPFTALQVYIIAPWSRKIAIITSILLLIAGIVGWKHERSVDGPCSNQVVFFHFIKSHNFSASILSRMRLIRRKTVEMRPRVPSGAHRRSMASLSGQRTMDLDMWRVLLRRALWWTSHWRPMQLQRRSH